MTTSFRKVLMLNASNMEKFPVYPYAFIQVPAVGRKAGIDVISKDLLGVSPELWKQTIRALIEQHDPLMILITLRNTDSLVSRDYASDTTEAYFPIERTRDLVNAIREVSDLKIVLGGFGFSLLPTDLMWYIRPDLGVLGGSDDFYAYFEEIEEGNYSKVPSLMFFQGEKLISNPRVLHPPQSEAEYTPQAINEMMKFYDAFPSPGFQGAPVEIMRGCCHSCLFCAEPRSAGSQVRYRDLDAIMKDIQILSDNGITKVYMISSELNPEGNEFILLLADRILAFNATQPEQKRITWYGANYLLMFKAEEYERLYQSGFTGGWFDITGLDDQNARAMRTPYRNERLIKNLRVYAEATKRQIDLRQRPEDSGSGTPLPAGDGRDDEIVRWTMFLGNPATTIETIRNTLHAAHQQGLPGLFDECGIIGITRVFDYEGLSESQHPSIYSVAPDMKRTGYQQLLPSFAFPSALLEVYSEEEIPEIFDHLAETYLSKKFQHTRCWLGFLQQNATVESVSRWTRELSKIKGIQMGSRFDLDKIAVKEYQTLFQEDKSNSDADKMAMEIVDLFVSASLNAFPDVFGSLDLPDTVEAVNLLTPYELAVIVFNSWELQEGLPAQIKEISPQWKQDILQFCVRAILYRFNILALPKYGNFFIHKQPINSAIQEKT